MLDCIIFTTVGIGILLYYYNEENNNGTPK